MVLNHQVGGVLLQTDSFSVIEVVRLINVLIIKFNCKCTLRYQRGNPVIYISRRSVRKLVPLLKQNIPIGIHYKINHVMK